MLKLIDLLKVLYGFNDFLTAAIPLIKFYLCITKEMHDTYFL